MKELLPSAVKDVGNVICSDGEKINNFLMVDKVRSAYFFFLFFLLILYIYASLQIQANLGDFRDFQTLHWLHAHITHGKRNGCH